MVSSQAENHMPGRSGSGEPAGSSNAALNHSPTDGFLYDAFISYSRSNGYAAAKIERDIERFPLPRDVRKRLGRRHLNVFRDVNDLTGNRLESGIERRLEESRALVVLCSPQARASKYVNMEIGRFAQLRDSTQIVPALVAGQPNGDAAVDPVEWAFPDALGEVLDNDALAVDLRGAWNIKGRKAKLATGSPWVQLIAGIVGATTDDLTGRIAKAERRRLQTFVAILVVVLMVVGALGAVARSKQIAATHAAQKVREVQKLSRLTAEVGVKPQRSLLLAVEAAALATDGHDENLTAVDGIRQQLRVAGGQPLLGHSGPTRAAAFSPDRRWLATGSDDGTIKLWNTTAVDPNVRSVSLAGHRGAIHGLAFSPDGRWLASGGADGTVRLWGIRGDRADTGPVLAGARYGEVESLAISPDGEWLAVGTQRGNTCIWRKSPDGFLETPCDVGKDRDSVANVVFSARSRYLATTCTSMCKAQGATVGLWDLGNGFPNQGPRRLKHADPLNEDSLLAVAFSADETRLAVTYGYMAEVWDLTQPDPPQHVSARIGHNQWIGGLALSPDNHWLATGSVDAEIRLSDLAQPDRAPITLKGHNAAVRALAFSDDGKWLASGSDDATARLWSMTDPTLPSTLLRGQDLPVGAVKFTPGSDSPFLLTMGTAPSDEPNARLWSIPDPSIDPVVLRPSSASLVIGMAVSPDGQWIATSSQGDTDVSLWSTGGDRAPAATFAMPAASHAVAFSANGRWLAAKSDDTGVISLWNLENRSAPPVHLHEIPSADFNSLSFSPDSRWLISGTWAGTLTMWDVSDDRPAATPRHVCLTDPVRGRANFSPDGHYVATAANGFAARLWDLRAPDPCASPRLLGPHEDAVVQVAFSPDSRRAATTSFDHKGRLWDLTAGQDPKKVAEVRFDDRVIETAFSPDNRWVAFGSWDRTAKVLNLADLPAAKPINLSGHAGRILTLGFTPDSRWLATGGEDQTVRLWDPADPATAPVILKGHEGSVFALDFSKDGRWIVSGSYDGTVRLWRLKLADLIDVACRTAGRDLTSEEVDTFLDSESPPNLCGDAGRR
jgi:WD40 repeat protein